MFMIDRRRRKNCPWCGEQMVFVTREQAIEDGLPRERCVNECQHRRCMHCHSDIQWHEDKGWVRKERPYSVECTDNTTGHEPLRLRDAKGHAILL